MEPKHFNVGDRLAAEFGCNVHRWTVQAVDGDRMLVRSDGGTEALWSTHELRERKAVRLPTKASRPTLRGYIRMLFHGRWIPAVVPGEQGWRAIHTRTGARVGGENTTRQMAVGFCHTANFS